MEWNKVMNFGDPSTFGTEMADRFVASGANLPPPVSNRVKVTCSYLVTFSSNLLTSPEKVIFEIFLPVLKKLSLNPTGLHNI